MRPVKDPNVPASLSYPNSTFDPAHGPSLVPESMFGSVDGRERFSLFADAIPHLVWTTDSIGNADYFNSRWTEFSGVPESELLGAGWVQTLHPDDRERVHAIWNESARTGKPYETEYRVRSREGNYHSFVARGTPMRDSSGAIYRWIGTTTDIEDEKRLEAERSRSEERFRAVADHSPVFLWLSDAEGHRYYFNCGWLDFVGSTLEENVGEGWRRYIHPDDRERCIAAYDRANQERSEYQIEYRLLNAKLGYRWVIAKGLPRFTDEGEFIGLVGSCVDITARKQQEQAVAASHEHFRILAESLPHIVWTTDAKGYPDYYNAYWYTYTGLTPEQSLNSDVRGTVFHPEDLAAIYPEWQRCMEEVCELSSEVRIRKSDGTYRWHTISTVPVRGIDGGVACWVGSILDIHDQKTVNAELTSAKEAADAANRAKDHFLATLSHELRTPLTPVLTTIETLELDDSLPEEVRPYIATIRRNVELEARLIDDLLDLTRITRGKIHLSRRSVEAHSLISNVLEICRKEITNKRIEVRMSLHAERVYIDADPARMQQILWNIMQNAVKFTPPEGSLAIRTRNNSCDQLVIEITDSGIGIDPEHVDHIFQPFEQGDHSITKQFGGLGLGLAISKMLVDMHEGTITASSEGRGRGSTFTLMFDTVPAPDLVLEIAKPLEKKAARKTRSKRRLLLVDDHADTNLSLKLLLERRGFEIVTADTMAKAIDLVEAGHYHLMISDIGLPDGSGWDLIRKVRETSGMKAIALSGFCTEEDIKRSKEAGFSEHLTKPFNFPDLQSVIERLLA